MNPTLCVIAMGNAFDGLSFVGPFPDSETAARYIESDPARDSGEWHIVPLDAPDETFKMDGD